MKTKPLENVPVPKVKLIDETKFVALKNPLSHHEANAVAVEFVNDP